jgi:hypothetical protein
MTCTHVWMIASPNGPTSRGVCQNCGAEKNFPNSGNDRWSSWERRDGSNPNDDPATGGVHDK